MKKILFISILALGLHSFLAAQDKVWTMEECMQYAVENSPTVRQKVHSNDTYKAEYASSIASFLPSLEGSISADYSFGRGLDPNTNTYIQNTTSFANDYRLNASLPLFTGGQLINQWRLSKVNRQVGMNDIQKAKDDLALKTMVAFVDVVYYQGTWKYAIEKLEESKRILYQTQRMADLGLKGKADVALIEAQVAEDDYNLTRQENLFNTALITLKDLMNYPAEEELTVDNSIAETYELAAKESTDDIFSYAMNANPIALDADYSVKAAKMNHLIMKGKLLPSIYLNGRISTAYNEKVKPKPVKGTTSFHTQFKENRGEYVGVSVSIPIFNRLSKVTEIRRARNNVRIAYEKQTETLRQLQTAIEKAVFDREGYLKEMVQMEKKQTADTYAYQVTLRKFEEGLMSPIDLQTNSNILLMTKANLLQRRLLYWIKCKEVEYYKGVPLVVNVED